ncbi:hypothetical protein V6N13_037738 [Hibiscus sabdariffa]|uniref:Uncharacterized protein n=1 Tax=Hibiscus sabdariffa TaxID=183260 RepID=A0ABR2S4Z9_9ROSI
MSYETLRIKPQIQHDYEPSRVKQEDKEVQTTLVTHRSHCGPPLSHSFHHLRIQFGQTASSHDGQTDLVPSVIAHKPRIDLVKFQHEPRCMACLGRPWIPYEFRCLASLYFSSFTKHCLASSSSRHRFGSIRFRGLFIAFWDSFCLLP